MALVCEQCGVDFDRPAYRRARFCSRDCVTLSLEKPPEVKPCAICGRRFETRFTGTNGGHRIQRFCSKECGVTSRRHNRAAKCAWCGVTFRPRFAAKGRLTKYHSAECAHEAQRRYSADERHERDRQRARDYYWRDLVAAGGTYIRVNELPSEIVPIARLIQETRRELRMRRKDNRGIART